MGSDVWNTLYYILSLGQKWLTDIGVEDHELRAELVPTRGVGPDEQHSWQCRGDEVMQPPPALDPRSVHLQDALPDSEGAVVPHQQEYEAQL